MRAGYLELCEVFGWAGLPGLCKATGNELFVMGHREFICIPGRLLHAKARIRQQPAGPAERSDTGRRLLGGGISALSICYMLLVAVLRLCVPNWPVVAIFGYASIIGMISRLGGFQFLGTWLLGEYTGLSL